MRRVAWLLLGTVEPDNRRRDWENGMTLRKLGIWSLVVAACSACSAADDAAEPATLTLHDELYVLTSSIWDTRSIPVCWETPGYTTEKNWVRQAIEQSWEVETSLVFYGWGSCSSASKGLRVRIQDSGGYVTALGQALDGVVNGVNLNSWESVTCSLGSRERCVRSTAVHEFGHALGFAHEQNRDDRTAECTQPNQGTDGDVIVGEFDMQSVMNYCNSIRNGDGRLSGTDIWGAQNYYGGSRPLSAVAFGTNKNKVSVFYRGDDAAIWQIHYNGSSWSNPFSLGGHMTSDPSALSELVATNNMNVFARGADGRLYNRWYDGSSWHSWAAVGDQKILGTPVALRRGNNAHVFARIDTNGGLGVARWNGSSWSWTTLSGESVGMPSAVSVDGSTVDLFYRAPDNTIRHRHWNGTSWGAAASLGGNMTGSPEATAQVAGTRLNVFARGQDGKLYTTYKDGGAWSTWRDLGGGFAQSPDAIAQPGDKLNVFARDANWSVTTKYWTGSEWGGFSLLGGVSTATPEGVLWSTNQLSVFFRDNSGGVSRINWNGSSWSSPSSLGGNVM